MSGAQLRMVSALALLIAALGIPRARADVVMPPPATCPPGSAPATGHMGPHCAPTRCTSATDCAAPTSGAAECLSQGLCVGSRHVWGSRGRHVDVSVTYGSCASDAECPAGIACEIALRCVSPGSIPGPVDGRLIPNERPRVEAVAAGSARASCGALGLVALLAFGASALGLTARARAQHARAEAVRVRLVESGRATQRELEQIARSPREVAVALAPLAHRVRVEVDEEGEAHFALDEASPGEPVARTTTRR